MRRAVSVCVAAFAFGCASEGPAGYDPDDVGARMLLEVSDDADFWAAPFPADHRRDANGRVQVAGFPNPEDVPIVRQLVDMLDGGSNGFGRTSAVYLPFSEPLGRADLPDLRGTLRGDALVSLIDITPDAATFGDRHPVQVRVIDESTGFGPRFGLALLPLQGVPLKARHRYAAVVKRTLRDGEGRTLGITPALDALIEGSAPSGWPEPAAELWLDAVEALDELGVPVREIGGLTVFTTADPMRQLERAFGVAEAVNLNVDNEPNPNLPSGALLQGQFSHIETHDDYCVYEAAISMPVLQAGEPPWEDGEGAFVIGDGGAPVVQSRASARAFLTLPRTPPLTQARLPTAVFVRTGGGGDRPLIDRGVRSAPGGDDTPGSGVAATLGRAGWVGVQVDGPLTGERNPTGGDEQLLVFDIARPAALRDNLRQSAIELALLPSLLAGVRVNTAPCWGAQAWPSTTPTIDAGAMVLIGHSMGATIAPMTLWLEPSYTGAVLSGAGGSWLLNVVHKQLPTPVRPIAAAMLQEPADALDVFHPALNLLQWAGEAADPPLYAEAVGRQAPRGTSRDVLMVQGVLDRYILPPIANAMSVPLGLDLAGPALDAELHPEWQGLLDVIDLGGGGAVNLPAGFNLLDGAGARTALVVQHEEDGVEDGHEVFYQLPGVRRQLRCFLRGLRDGASLVPEPGAESAPCPTQR